MTTTLYAGMLLITSLSAQGAGTQPVVISDEIKLAEAGGFDIYEHYKPGIGDQAAASSLLEAVKKIVEAKVELDSLGAGSTPKDVEKWRDRKINEHHETIAALRKQLAAPERSREIYERHIKTRLTYEGWTKWSQHYSSAEKIDKIANQVSFGRYRIDLSSKRPIRQFRLLGEYLDEIRSKAPSRKTHSSQILSASDEALLGQLAEFYGSYGLPAALPSDAGSPAAATSIQTAFAQSVYLAPLETEYQAILERECFDKLKVRIYIPALKDALKPFYRTLRSARTRRELLAPMSLSDAVAALDAYDGKAMLAALTLAKAGREAVPALLEGLSMKGSWGASIALSLLNRLSEKEAVPRVIRLKLHEAANESTAAQALALIGRLRPDELESIVAAKVAQDESGRYLEGLPEAFTSSDVRLAVYFLGRCGGDSGRNRLRRYLKSPRLGIRLEAARALVLSGDDSGAETLLGYLENSKAEDDIVSVLNALWGLRGAKYARRFDAIAAKKNIYQLNFLARRIEFEALPAAERWNYLGDKAADADQEVAIWAFLLLEDGCRKRVPEAQAVIARIAAGKTEHAQRAQELIEAGR